MKLDPPLGDENAEFPPRSARCQLFDSCHHLRFRVITGPRCTIAAAAPGLRQPWPSRALAASSSSRRSPEPRPCGAITAATTGIRQPRPSCTIAVAATGLCEPWPGRAVAASSSSRRRPEPWTCRTVTSATPGLRSWPGGAFATSSSRRLVPKWEPDSFLFHLIPSLSLLSFGSRKAWDAHFGL